MKNIFNLDARTEILDRIDQLGEESRAQWGKMNAAQMLVHCFCFHEIALGKSQAERSWLGMVIGRFVKPVFYNDKPSPRNMSTIPSILISDKRELETEKRKLKQQIMSLPSEGAETCAMHPHPFFGKMSPEQWGKGLYKHLDHHLKQFGA